MAPMATYDPGSVCSTMTQCLVAFPNKLYQSFVRWELKIIHRKIDIFVTYFYIE